LISAWFQTLGIILPATIGAMLAGAVVSNLDGRFRFARIRQEDVNQIGQISLYLFIVMALVSLRLWELAQLAAPMLVILAAQVLLCVLMCVTLAYWVIGRDYDGAVGAGGVCGYMLGITTNTGAVVEEILQKNRAAPRPILF